ncbi:MAG: GTPase HflX [Acidobacteria bacterium]|nr:GTPase HflX [Acidobacteriota bacterium]
MPYPVGGLESPPVPTNGRSGRKKPSGSRETSRGGRARQRAWCVAAGADGGDLSELEELLLTAGVAVVGSSTQRRERPHPNTYVGAGKLEEIRREARAADANLIVTDDELSARQERNLEGALKIPVIDRTTVILDIFAGHAHSSEGKLQVELAQLQYNLARMRGLWTHLERLGGGIGTRGPGETQIETDQRLARNRIAALTRRLGEVAGSRATMRAERQRNRIPTVALAGYTNAGKSSLMNALTGAGVVVRDRLFETLDPTTREMEVDGRSFLLTDTVGFIRKLPHQLVRAFGATLEETLRADLVLHVFDSSVPEEQLRAMLAAVDDALGQFGESDQRQLLVANKIDLADPDRRRELRIAFPDAIQVSGLTGEGVEELRSAIGEAFSDRFEPVELLVPYADGEAIAEVHRLGGRVEREERADGVLLRTSLPRVLARRLSGYSTALGAGR